MGGVRYPTLMRKTSVYLTDAEAEGLRRASMRAGRSQSELIREGVRLVIRTADAQPRTFRSLGRGRGDGRPAAGWDADALLRRVMGER
jgi:Arc/MetJ-type ribon-helix-helix transcriptional regulator